MVVAPGFIDPHTHVEEQLASTDARTRLIPGFLMQGVTTAVIGNDGGGSPDMAKSLGHKDVGINYAAHVGFGAVRGMVVGAGDRAPTAAELARMKTLGRGRDVPRRDRLFERAVLCAAELRQDRRGGGARGRSWQARRLLRQPHPRRIQLRHRPGRGDRRSDRDRPAGTPAGAYLAHQGAGRGRAGPGPGDHRQGGGRAPRRAGRDCRPISVGRDRARAWSRRWSRAGRRTAGGRRC